MQLGVQRWGNKGLQSFSCILLPNETLRRPEPSSSSAQHNNGRTEPLHRGGHLAVRKTDEGRLPHDDTPRHSHIVDPVRLLAPVPPISECDDASRSFICERFRGPVHLLRNVGINLDELLIAHARWRCYEDFLLACISDHVLCQTVMRRRVEGTWSPSASHTCLCRSRV